MGLNQSDVIAFIATVHADRAKSFYADTLGLRLVADEPFALVFDANGTAVRIAKVESFSPAQHTVMGWRVDDIDTTVDGLVAKGVTFERFPGMDQDERGVWQSPGGTRIAWFKDPDGNTLSLTAGA